jgi:hypothetical protein
VYPPGFIAPLSAVLSLPDISGLTILNKALLEARHRA